MYFVPSLVETGSLVLENTIFFKFCLCCLTISLFSPLEKRRGPLFEHTWISRLPNSDFCQVWLKLAQWDLIMSMFFFHYFVIISPLNRAGPFNSPSIHTKMLCVKFDRASVKLWKVHRQTDDRRTESQPRVICQLHQELTFHRYNIY